MAENVVSCPQCGVTMKVRLGSYECPHCGTSLDPAQLAASESQRDQRHREQWQPSPKGMRRPEAGDPWAGTVDRREEKPEPLGPYSVPSSGMAIPASGSGVLPAFLSPPDAIYSVARAEIKVDKLRSEKAVYLGVQMLLCLGPTVIYTPALAMMEEYWPGIGNILIGGMLFNLVLTVILLYMDYLWVKFLGCGLMVAGVTASLAVTIYLLGNPFMRGVALFLAIGIGFQVWLFSICYRDIIRLKMQAVVRW